MTTEMMNEFLDSIIRCAIIWLILVYAACGIIELWINAIQIFKRFINWLSSKFHKSNTITSNNK